MPLVLDVSGQAQTAAALGHGCATYDPSVTIAGIILNRVASPRHRALVAHGFYVLGALLKGDALGMPERYLSRRAPWYRREARYHSKLPHAHVDIDAIEALARPLVLRAVHETAGLLGPSFSFPARKIGLGYRAATLAVDSTLGASGTAPRGHEFH